MKKFIEIILVVIIFFAVVYSLLYMFYFDSFCKNFTWRDENNISFAIHKMASCKDSFVCYPDNIKTNNRNEVNNWDCVKKDSPIFGADLYIDIFNHFKNSVTK